MVEDERVSGALDMAADAPRVCARPGAVLGCALGISSAGAYVYEGPGCGGGEVDWRSRGARGLATHKDEYGGSILVIGLARGLTAKRAQGIREGVANGVGR